MKYRFKAKKGPSQIIEGTIEAATQDLAIAHITEQGLVPVVVEEESEYQQRESATPKPRGPLKFSSGRISKNALYNFTRQLKTLLKAHVPILNSLYILENQVVDKRFKEIVTGIIESVRQGANFSEGLNNFPHCFSPLYISIVRAGEASGKLDNSLEQITAYLERERQLSQKVIASLAYPIFMVLVGIATVIFLMTFVIPKLSTLFEDFVEQIPLVTKILFFISSLFAKHWIFVIFFSVGLVLFIIYNLDAPWQRRLLYNIRKHTPIIKDVTYNQSLCRFSRALSILLSSGVSLLDSIEIAAPLVEDEKARRELNEVHKNIVSGSGLEESLRYNCNFLPDLFIKMVAIGEASGKLDEILAELSENYAEEVETKTKIITSLIEPIAIIVVGGILGFVVIAVLLPIFEISFFVE